MASYSMGIDFGTLSARAVIIDTATGEEKGVSVCEYAHGVISDKFINGKALPKDFALQHPMDYKDSLFFVIKESIKVAGIDPADIIGIGVDFTASTVMPVFEDGTPLCFDERFKNSPHAYVKLWKHHAAEEEAKELNALAKNEAPKLLERYGGTISSEWLFPKVLETLRKDKAT